MNQPVRTDGISPIQRKGSQSDSKDPHEGVLEEWDLSDSLEVDMSLALARPAVHVVVLLLGGAEQHLVQDLGVVGAAADPGNHLVEPPERVALDQGNLDGKKKELRSGTTNKDKRDKNKKKE